MYVIVVFYFKKLSLSWIGNIDAFSGIEGRKMNVTSQFLTTTIEPANLCPSQRAITRPLLFVHNYSLFIFGSILNILAFIVLMQNSLRCHSTFAYLAFLSLSNGILSFVRFVQWFITYYFKIQLESYLSACRLSHFTLDLLTHFSLFTLVCVNIDRAQTVTRSRPSSRFSRSSFHLVILKELIIAMILCTYHLHWLIKFGYESNCSSVFFMFLLVDLDHDGNRTQTVCHFDSHQTPTYAYFFLHIYPRVEFVIFFCFPLLMNSICTILIVRSLRVRMRTAKRFSRLNQIISESQENSEENRCRDVFSCFIPRTTTKSNIYSCFCFQIQCRRHREMRLKISRTERGLIKDDDENDSIDRQPIPSTILTKTHRTRRTRDIHLSAMLIVLNIVYLIFNSPYNLHQIFHEKLYKHRLNDCMMRFLQLLFDMFQQMYFSTNFFLYVLTNRRFREEFYNMIMKLFVRKRQYLLRKSVQERRNQSFSLNQSTAILSNFNGEHQTIPLVNQLNREIHSPICESNE